MTCLKSRAEAPGRIAAIIYIARLQGGIRKNPASHFIGSVKWISETSCPERVATR
jgi:hypothetical protein